MHMSNDAEYLELLAQTSGPVTRERLLAIAERIRDYSALEMLREIIAVADAEPECVTEAMWKRIADAKAVVAQNERTEV